MLSCLSNLQSSLISVWYYLSDFIYQYLLSSTLRWQDKKITIVSLWIVTFVALMICIKLLLESVFTISTSAMFMIEESRATNDPLEFKYLKLLKVKFVPSDAINTGESSVSADKFWIVTSMWCLNITAYFL